MFQLFLVPFDPFPLLFHARDNALETIEDNEDNRRKGWQRISLFALYLRPSVLEVTPIGQMFRDALKAPSAIALYRLQKLTSGGGLSPLPKDGSYSLL